MNKGAELADLVERWQESLKDMAEGLARHGDRYWKMTPMERLTDALDREMSRSGLETVVKEFEETEERASEQ